MPGMTCKTKITIYDVKDAIVIPAELVQTDEDDPKQKYVMLQVEGEEKPVRRDVKVGKTKEKEVEIVKGLRGGRRHRQRGQGREEDEKKDKRRKNDEKKDADRASGEPGGKCASGRFGCLDTTERFATGMDLMVRCFTLLTLPASPSAWCAGAAAKDAVDAETKPFPYPLALEGPKPKPVTPPTTEELTASITRGVDFLLESQRDSGAWGGPQKTKDLNIFAPVPGAHLAFRTGVTALAIEALIDARSLFDDEKQQAIDAAIDRGQQWLLVHSGKLRRAEQEALYNVWGHAYGLQTSGDAL